VSGALKKQVKTGDFHAVFPAVDQGMTENQFKLTSGWVFSHLKDSFRIPDKQNIAGN